MPRKESDPTATMNHPEQLLIELFDAAVTAASPEQIMNQALAGISLADQQRDAVVIGAGKAAASMAKALEQRWAGKLEGLVVTRYGHQLDCSNIVVEQASHPVPDQFGEAVSKRMLAMVANLSADDLVICLISGGGSALLALPSPGLTLKDKQTINKALLLSGATIEEMNTVRKHLSAIKGGRLAAACYPAKIITLAISDVPGDDPTVIASGPTVGDPTTSTQALAILRKYQIDTPVHVAQWLQNEQSETLKPGDPRLCNSFFNMIATPHQSLQAAKHYAEQAGLATLVLGDDIEGESREVAKVHAAIVRSILKHQQPISPPCVILSGGETTVTIKGKGRGGRNAEFLLSLACCLKGLPGVYAIAADTDGIDGSEDNAGALLSPDSWQRAIEEGLDAAAMLDNNDAYRYFEAINDLVITGPTLTNVNDFRAILVLPGKNQRAP